MTTVCNMCGKKVELNDLNRLTFNQDQNNHTRARTVLYCKCARHAWDVEVNVVMRRIRIK